MKIRTLLIITLAVFSLFSMILFTVFAGVSLSSVSVSEYKDMMTEMARKQSCVFEVYLESYSRRAQSVEKNPDVADYIAYLENGGFDFSDPSRAKALEAMEAMVSGENALKGISIFNEQNSVVLSAGIDQHEFLMGNRLRKLNENQFAAVPSPVINALDQSFDIVRYVKVSDSHYIICTFGEEDIRTFFNRSAPPASGKTVLICPLQNLIDHGLRGNIDESALGTPEYAAIRRYTGSKSDVKYRNGTEFFTYEVGNNTFYAFFTGIGETGWLLGVIGRADDMRTHSSSSVISLINCTIFIGAAMVTLNVLFSVRFTRPLLIIRDTLTKVRRGDHTARMNIFTGNEYGRIATEFNELLDNVVVSESRYRTVVEMSDDIIFEWNFQTGNVFFSKNFSKKFSYRPPTDSYEDSFLVKCKIHPEDAAAYKKTLDKLSVGEPVQQDEFRWKNIFGDYMWVLMRATAIRGAGNNIVKVVGVIIDIDRAKKSELILSARASYDALTGLYNRETVESLINNEIELITARKNEFAILFVDVDDFKQYNDNYSHATGDQVLKFTAVTINDVVSKFGMAGRYGGDEFVICIRNSETNDPSKAAVEMLAKLKEGFVCDMGDRLSVAVSIGIAIIRDSSKHVDEIIGLADDAMYKIKKSGKSNYGFIN